MNESLKQWVKFASVGALGTAVNAVSFAFFSLFEFFQFAPLTVFGITFGKELTLAWGSAILVAMVGNFLLNKHWVFPKNKEEEK